MFDESDLQINITIKRDFTEKPGIDGVVRDLEGTHLADRFITNKTRKMPFIPTKSVACMSMSWLLGNVYTAKSCKAKSEILTL
jgi:hypothetical protein